jgi:hypothetical protein
MRTRLISLLAGLAFLGTLALPLSAHAAGLTRVHLYYSGDDLFKDLDSGYVFETLGCYVYVYGDEAVYDEGRNELLVQGQKCSVQGIYEVKYRLTQIADDLYQDTRSSNYVRTDNCSVSGTSDVLLIHNKVFFLDKQRSCRIAA